MSEHTHAYGGITSYDNGHVHQYSGEATLAPNTRGHFHYIEGVTSYNREHDHTYKIRTSVDYPVGKGNHIHYVKGNVNIAKDHIHTIKDKTSIEIY